MSIIDTLCIEKGLLFELLNTLKAEKEMLINDNIEELSKIVKTKEELKKQIEDIEKIRLEKYDSKSLKEILPTLQGSERDQAQKLGEEMENLVSLIQEINDTNDLLIKQSLSYVRSLINIMSPRKVTVYNPAGQVQDSVPGSSMFNKSV